MIIEGEMVGSVFRLRSWRHYPAEGPLTQIEYGHPDRNVVGVFVLLGFERKDGKGPRVNPEEVVKLLGKEIG